MQEEDIRWQRIRVVASSIIRHGEAMQCAKLYYSAAASSDLPLFLGETTVQRMLALMVAKSTKST